MGSEIQRTDSKSAASKEPSVTNSSTGSTPNGSLANGEVAELTILIDENDVQAGAREVLHSIRPTWRDENIQFKVCTYAPPCVMIRIQPLSGVSFIDRYLGTILIGQ